MITQLSIQAFRGIQDAQYSFTARTHIRGPNGSGKTHILDALHLLSGSRIIYGESSLESQTRLGVVFGTFPLLCEYSVAMQHEKEHYFVQGSRMTRPKYLAALPFRSVGVSPFDMNILYFAPDMRRAYMDDILLRTYEQFRQVKRSYETTVRQRNALLRRIREWEGNRADLDIWDHQVSELAMRYGAYRRKYIEYVNALIPTLPDFFWKYHMSLVYVGEWLDTPDPQKTIREYLQTHRDRDILSGHTHIWPHRDDFFLEMQRWDLRHNAQFFLSRGETKMLLLGLKVIEADFVQKQTQKSLILLVDDVLAELDDMNARRFLEIMTPHQMILTSQKPLPHTEKNQDFSCINLALP